MILSRNIALLFVFFSSLCLGHQTLLAKDPDIYISGFYERGGAWMAFYYKNNERVELGAGQAYAVHVSGNVVYAAGYFKDNGRGGGCYWKNGSRVEFPEVPKLNDIFIYNNSVYTCALFDDPKSLRKYPCLYREKEKTALDDKAVWPSSVFVDNNRVFVLGSGSELVYGLKGLEKKNLVYYYRDGRKSKVSEDADLSSSAGESSRKIWVSGDDLYILLSKKKPGNKSFAVLWAKGRESVVFEGSPGTLFLRGKDIYVCGEEKGKGVVYKNGRLLYTLETGAKAKIYSDKYKRFHMTEIEAHIVDIRVSGKDVYALGSYEVPVEGSLHDYNQVICLWRNGIKKEVSSIREKLYPTSLFLGAGAE